MVNTIRKRIMVGVYSVQIIRPSEQLTDKDNFHITGSSHKWVVMQNGEPRWDWYFDTIQKAEYAIQESTV